MSHDPGPWKMAEFCDGKIEVHVAKLMPGGGRGEGICEVHGWGLRQTENAKLIASAPELKEQLAAAEREIDRLRLLIDDITAAKNLAAANEALSKRLEVEPMFDAKGKHIGYRREALEQESCEECNVYGCEICRAKGHGK